MSMVRLAPLLVLQDIFVLTRLLRLPSAQRVFFVEIKLLYPLNVPKDHIVSEGCLLLKNVLPGHFAQQDLPCQSHAHLVIIV